MRDSAKGTYRNTCKLCMRAYNNQYFSKTPARQESVRRLRKETRAKLLEWARGKLLTGCVDCGIKDSRVLEFDHVEDGKLAGVMEMARAGSARSKIEAEIAKCVVRCRNCHSIVTYERAGWNYVVLPS